jgi:hypothetical protein
MMRDDRARRFNRLRPHSLRHADNPRLRVDSRPEYVGVLLGRSECEQTDVLWRA